MDQQNNFGPRGGREIPCGETARARSRGPGLLWFGGSQKHCGLPSHHNVKSHF